MRIKDNMKAILVNGPYDLARLVVRHEKRYIKMYLPEIDRPSGAEPTRKTIKAYEINYRLVGKTPSGTLIYEYEDEAA